jgi:hypothetical protein
MWRRLMPVFVMSRVVCLVRSCCASAEVFFYVDFVWMEVVEEYVLPMPSPLEGIGLFVTLNPATRITL